MHSLNSLLGILFICITKKCKPSWPICYFIHHQVDCSYSWVKTLIIVEGYQQTDLLKWIKVEKSIWEMGNEDQVINFELYSCNLIDKEEYAKIYFIPSTSWPKFLKAFRRLSSVVRKDNPETGKPGNEKKHIKYMQNVILQ